MPSGATGINAMKVLADIHAHVVQGGHVQSLAINLKG
jgi:hypothetical protein